MSDLLNRGLVDRIVASFAVPVAILGVPRNDGTWTTEFADLLDSIGEPEKAAAERLAVLGKRVPYRPEMRVLG